MAKGYRKEYINRLNGNRCLNETDVLAILLGNAYGGKDMSGVARALLERFPGIRSIIEADIREIEAVDGVTENIAAYLKTLDRVIKLSDGKHICIKDSEQCFEVAFSRLCPRDNEFVEMYLVNKNGRVTKIKRYTSDKAYRVDIAAAEVLSVISSTNAYGLYFVHNHVNVAATPSANDDKVTATLITACKMCNLKFFDHCIVSSTGDKFSYRLSGRLEELSENQSK